MIKIINGIIFLLITVLSLGQLQRISFLNQQINIFAYELLMAIFILFLAIHTLFKNKFSFKKILKIKLNFFEKNKELILAIGYFILTLILSFAFTYFKFNNQENIVAAMYLGRMIFYFIFFLFLLFYINTEKTALNIVKKSVTVFFVLTFILSAIQYFLYPDLRNLYYQGWDPHLYRLFGTYFDISILGVVYIISAVWFAKNRVMQIFSLLAIYFTYSRITYISFLTSMFYMFYEKINWIKIFAVTCLFVGFLFLLPRQAGAGVALERTFSIQSRTEDLKSGLDTFVKQPILGIGYNHIRYVKNTESLHSGASYSSSYMTILVSSGIIGLFFLLRLLIVIYTKLNDEGRYLIFPILVSSLFDNVLFTGLMFVFFLILVAINLSHKKQ